MSQSSDNQNTALLPVHNLNRTKGYSNASGFDYEYKMAGLLYVRARNMKLDCEVFFNVDEMEPGGDIVINLMQPRGCVICVQQKLREKSVMLSVLDFVKDTGDYSIKRYYEIFEKRKKKCLQKRKLKCIPEQVRMIIFTTKEKSSELNTRPIAGNHQITVTEDNINHSGEESHQEPTSADLIFDIDALFNTNKGIPGFSFGKEETEVWTLMDDKGPEEMEFYRNIFLPRFIVFSNQSSADDLDGMLERALQEGLKSLPHYRVKELKTLFLKNLKEWAANRKETRSVGHKGGPLATALAEILRPSPQLINGVDICFDSKQISTLHDVVKTLRPCEYQGKRRALVLIEDVPPPWHRVKILQVLRTHLGNRWMLIGQEDVRGFPPKALQFASGACDVIVIDIEDIDAVQLEIMNTEAAVVFLRFSTTADIALRRKGWNLAHLKSPWELDQLIPEAQNAILNLDISFQGNTINLSDMKEIWPGMRNKMNGQFLGDVLQRKLTLGEAFAVDEEETPPFIDRRIAHAPIFHKDDINALPEEFVVALSLCPPDLQNLRFRVLSESDENSSRKMEADAFNRICDENTDTTVIGFRCLNNELFLLEYVRLRPINVFETHEKILKSLQKCFNTQDMLKVRYIIEFERSGRVLCQNASSLNCITSINTKVALLVSDPGSGKSRLFQEAVKESRQSNPKHWTIFVRALDYGKLFNNVNEQPNGLLSCMEIMLMTAAGIKNPLAESCLRAALYESGCIDIYVDGVDELCPTYKTIALQVLELLQSTTKVRRLWISSRPEVENDLQSTLKCSVFHLLPLSSYEQDIFLHRSCDKIFPNSNLSIPGVVILLKRLGGSLLTWPLHAWMTVKAFQGITNKDPNMGNEFHLPHLTLYRGFVEQKKQEYMKRFGLGNFENTPMVDTFKPIHQNCAMFYLVSSKLIDIPVAEFQSYIESNKKYLEKEKRGMVWLQDDSLCFIHFTLAEYFAAEWMFDNRSKPRIQAFLRKMYKTGYPEGVKRFLDYFLFENLPLHTAICTGNNDKIKTLLSKDTLKARDGLGRTVVHVAANYGNMEALKKLLEEKRHAFSCDKLKLNALHYAAAALNLEGAELLLQKGASSECMTRLTEVANNIHHLPMNAAFRGLLEVSRSFLQEMREEVLATIRPQLIRAAIAGGQDHILHLIFDHHLSLYSTQYMMEKLEEQRNLTEAVFRGNKSVVEVLLEHCRDKLRSVNGSARDGTSMLHIATMNGHSEVIRVLVDHGADLTAKTTHFHEIQEIPLHPFIFPRRKYKIPTGSTAAKIARRMGKRDLARELKKMENEQSVSRSTQDEKGLKRPKGKYKYQKRKRDYGNIRSRHLFCFVLFLLLFISLITDYIE